MITIYRDDQRLYHGKAELSDGQWVPCYKRPERATLQGGYAVS